MISDPKLLILDEPANFVDNKFEKELYRTLHELNTRMAIVMVSHDIGTITSVVKEIVCVNRRVHRHRSNVLTEEQLRNYDCPIQLVSHGHIPATMVIQPGALGRRMPPCGVIRLYLSRSARRHNCLCRTTNTVRRYSG